MQRKSTCTPKDMYWESSDQNRTGLNWMMLKEASTSFPALIWSKVFWKEVKIFKNFYVQYGCFNDVIGFHLQSVAEAWRISVRHSKFSSCFVEYYIANEGGADEWWWRSICLWNKGRICSVSLQRGHKWAQTFRCCHVLWHHQCIKEGAALLWDTMWQTRIANFPFFLWWFKSRVLIAELHNNVWNGMKIHPRAELTYPAL